MTDKQIKNPCDTCKVEPPALKFKCPTCEHNQENKQIIDGKDCSFCSRFSHCNNNNLICRARYYSVKNQLNRKEQECERLKNQLIKYDDVRNILKSELDFIKDYNGEIICLQVRISKLKKLGEIFNRIDQLKVENEELRKFQKLLEEQMKFNKSELELSLSSETKRSEFLLREFKKVDKQRDNWREKAEKYFKTLTEIKEIAEDFYKTGFVRTDCDATLINNNTCITTLEQILQKISEVEPQTVDLVFWDKNGEYKEDIQTVDITKE